jgi:hypothetical protein
VTARWVEEIRSGLQAYQDWAKSRNTGETVKSFVAASMSEDRYDTQGSDAEHTKNERNSGTPLGDALFELLTLKFHWESKQKRRKNEK